MNLNSFNPNTTTENDRIDREYTEFESYAQLILDGAPLLLEPDPSIDTRQTVEQALQAYNAAAVFELSLALRELAAAYREAHGITPEVYPEPEPKSGKQWQ